MGAWLLSIVGVITLGVLVDILLPDGQTNKYVKGVFSVITLFVIISPLPKFLSSNFDIETALNFNAAEFEIDEKYLEGISDSTFLVKEKGVERYLAANGYSGATAKIVAKTDSSAKLDYINVNLKNVTLPSDTPHKDISDKVKTLVSAYLETSTDNVRVLYE